MCIDARRRSPECVGDSQLSRRAATGRDRRPGAAGRGGARGAADPSARDDGLRARHARVPGRAGRCGRCRSGAGGEVRRCRPMRRPSDSVATWSRRSRWPRTSRRSGRRSRRSACCWPTTRPGRIWWPPASRLLADAGVVPGDRRLAGPAAADGPAGAALALGDAGVDAAAVRCAVLRGGVPGGRGGDPGRGRGRGAGLASAARRARIDGGGRPRHVVADLDHAHAAGARRFDRGHRGAAGAGSARGGRRRGRGRRTSSGSRCRPVAASPASR